MFAPENLPAKFKEVKLPSGTYAACGIQVQWSTVLIFAVELSTKAEQVRLQRKQMQFLVQVSCPSQVFLSAGLLVYQVFPSISDLVQERAPAPITQYLFTIETRNNSERRNFTNLYLFVELLQKINRITKPSLQQYSLRSLESSTCSRCICPPSCS